MKFLHLRQHANVGQGLTQTKEITAWGGATIGFTSEVVGNEEVIVYTIAKVNPADNFCKKIGRKITEGRMQAGKNIGTIKVPVGLPRGEILDLLKEQYYKEEKAFDSEVRDYVF